MKVTLDSVEAEDEEITFVLGLENISEAPNIVFSYNEYVSVQGCSGSQLRNTPNAAKRIIFTKQLLFVVAVTVAVVV